MRKISAFWPVLIAGVVFSFGAILLAAQEGRTAASAAAEVSGQRSAVSAETADAGMPAVAPGAQAGRQTTNEVQSGMPVASVQTALTNEEQRTKNEERFSTPANDKKENAGGVAEIAVAAKNGASPESGGTKGDSAGPAGTNLITVAFDNVPVQDVVNMFAQISGANIIMAGSFTNLFVTANLKNVDWKSALNLALGSVNLSMIEDPSGILMVVTSDIYPKKLQEIEATKPLITRTMVPRYLNAVDLVEQIKLFKVLSPRGSITTSQSARQDVINLKSSETKAALTIQNPSITTAIVITDIKEYVDKVEALVLALDKREPQVFIEARIINVASASGKQTGVDWSMLGAFGVQAGLNNLNWNYNDSHSVQNSRNNTFNQFDNRNNLDGVNQRYDINGQQYEEKTTTRTYDPQGNPIDTTVVTPTRTISDNINRGQNIADTRADTILDSMTQTRTATAFMNVSQVALVLSALENNNNAEMISHPQLVVGNRVEAKIHVGQRFPVLPTVKTDNTQAGSAPNITYSDGPEIILDLGLTLWVIPEIDLKHNTVRLTVRPETATHNGDVKNPQTGKTYPIVDSRDLTTRINVPSGQTVAIGGLVENKTSKVEIKVPILGDIPLLGLLFRHTTDQVIKNNLIIMITPTILDDNRPLTGLEIVAQQTMDKFGKIPLAAVKANPSNAVSGVSIGATAVTPAAGMGQKTDDRQQTTDAGRQTAPTAPVPSVTAPAKP
ncbi:MAG: hypothetical protein WC381_01565 [Kiritimatiellia bacterium]|jgi:type II secretory pathway component GspD/PulD (secretin)